MPVESNKSGREGWEVGMMNEVIGVPWCEMWKNKLFWSVPLLNLNEMKEEVEGEFWMKRLREEKKKSWVGVDDVRECGK